MSELSIKVNIANRVYPLKVKRSEEEEIRRTANIINDRIKDLETKYAVKDKQDLLAMVALEFGSKSEQSHAQWSESENLLNEVRDLNSAIKEVL